MSRDLIDDDGENRAVRMFLAQYGCNPGTTIGQMRKHLEMSGFAHWPGWVDQVSQAGHLTKGGAQNWLRHLFALEDVLAQKPEASDVQGEREANAILTAEVERLTAELAALRKRLAEIPQHDATIPAPVTWPPTLKDPE